MNYNQKVKDIIIRVMTYVASFISVIILGSIILFVFIEGLPLLNFDIIFGDNQNKAEISMKIEPTGPGENYAYETKAGEYFSSRYGVAFIDTISLEGHLSITISYIDPDSPFMRAEGKGKYNGQIFSLKPGDVFLGVGILAWGDDYPDGINIPIQIQHGSAVLAEQLDQTYIIANITPMILGGGIRGSIITTLYLIGMTLLIALPIGIASALYIHELAPQNKMTEFLRSFIDMLTGVPSIIYGLMGAAFFIPLSQAIFGGLVTGGNLIAGAMTLAVIVLPVIIRATESALDVVPKDYKLASLALGANETQTTLKIMLPNALPGVLSATLLAIGRVMGESAALIYAIGTAIKDDVVPTGNGTSLAVHIWASMAGEQPNFALASTISIILLAVVLTLNLLVKFVTNKFINRYS